MSYLRTIIVSLIIICIPLSLSRAQSSAGGTPDIDQQIIETLGLAHRVVYLAEDFKDFLKHNPFPQSDGANKQALNAYEQSYSRDQLMQAFKQVFAQKVDKLPEKALRSWLNQESTQKLAQARNQYYSLQGKRKRIVALYELEQDPASAERQQLIATYADTRTEEQLLLDTRTLVLISAIKKIDQLNDQIDIPKSRLHMLAKQTRKKPNNIQQHRQKKLRVIFYQLSSQTVQASLDFWQSQAGQSLNKAIYQSLNQAYKKAAQQLTQSTNQSDN